MRDPIKQLRKLVAQLDVTSAVKQFYDTVLDLWSKNDEWNQWWDIVDVKGSASEGVVDLLEKEDIIAQEEIFIPPLDLELFQEALLEQSEWLGVIWKPERLKEDPYEHPEKYGDPETWDSYLVWHWTPKGEKLLKEIDLPFIKVNPERLGLR